MPRQPSPNGALRAALAHADLLGFDTKGWRRNRRSSGAKAAFIGNPPVINGAATALTYTSGSGAQLLEPNVAVTDSSKVRQITFSTSAGFNILTDTISHGTVPANATVTESATSGTYTFAPTSSTATAGAFIDSFAFTSTTNATHNATISFSVTNGNGFTSNFSIVVADNAPVVVTTTPTTPTAPVTPSASAALPTQFSNLSRIDPNSPDALAPTITGVNGQPIANPLYVQAQAAAAIQAQYNAGKLYVQDAQLALFHLVDGTVSLAEMTYSFFTGTTPTSAGLNYLVHSSANPTDLNDAYFAQFSTENRFINQSVSLGTGAGAGAAAFASAYGGLSLSDAATTAYTAVFGVAPATGKIDAILNAQVSNGLGGTETRAQYFADITASAQGSLAQKAAVVGFFLADGLVEGSAYANADQHFLADLAHGTAAYGINLLTGYGPNVTVTGQVVADPSVPH